MSFIPAPPLLDRPERFELRVPLIFLLEGVEFPGSCVNVSRSGMLAVFASPLEVWTVGVLSLQAGEHYLTLPARVARTQNRDAGLSFLLQTENDFRAVEILVGAAEGLLMDSK